MGQETVGSATGTIRIGLWNRAFEILNVDQLTELRDWLSSVIHRDLEGVTGDPRIDRVSVQFLEECLKAAEEQRACIQNRLDHLRGLH